MSRSNAGFLAFGLVALFVLGTAIRLNNAFAYPVNLGFDAPENWRYIHGLMHSWKLPAPDSDWSTAHPPFFYYASAVIARLGGSHEASTAAIAIRIVGSALGLLAAGLCAWLVHRVAPASRVRSALAAGLVLLLPVHLYMSAMLNEEVWASFLVTLVVVGCALELLREEPTRGGQAWARALALGGIAGLALLTKLSGLLVIAAAAGAFALAGWKRGQKVAALRFTALLVGSALLVGGWFYARNWIEWGYLYPQNLYVHEVMFSMPPGERSVADYLVIPASTFLDPQLVDEDLLHSVWGSAYATLWFDGHRHFLARESQSVTLAGTFILLLALLPTAAFFVGMARGLRRALRNPVGPDTPLLLLSGFTLVGFVAFTAQNPWFAAVKGSYLLGMLAPFSFYASEVLYDWTRGGGLRAKGVWLGLALLAVAVVVVFTYGPVYWNWSGRGIEWIRIPNPTLPSTG